MKQFDHSFYTDDFDQEMLDFLKQEGFIVTDNHWNEANIKDVVLRYNAAQEAFWTTSGNVDKSFGVYLTKQEFKKRIGMTKTNGSLERWKNGDKRLQVETEYLTDERKNSLWVLFDQLGWSNNDIREFSEGCVWTNTLDCGVEPFGVLMHGDDLDPSYPLSTVEDLEEIVKYEESENMKEGDNTFTKDMLVSGEHVVECRNGDKYLVFKDRLIESGGYNELEEYKDNLTYKDCEPAWDIVSVYKHVSAPDSLEFIFEEGNLTLVWQRTSSEKLKLLEEVSSVEEEIKTLQERLEKLKIELKEIDGE